MLAETLFGDRTKGRPVCLLVDEIQNAGPKNAEALAKLHNATLELPILPVYAGLNDSVDALRRCGISRLSDEADLNLPLLSIADAFRAADSMLVRYRVAGEHIVLEDWAKAIAEDSLGFPQHLHVGLKAAARALVEDGGEATRDSLDRARQDAAERRKAYYRHRLSPEVERHDEALVHLIRTVAGANEPMTWRRLYAVADELLRNDSLLDKKGRNPGRLVDALIHDGILQRTQDGTGYMVPIPSMQSWILGDYARSIGLETSGSS